MRRRATIIGIAVGIGIGFVIAVVALRVRTPQATADGQPSTSAAIDQSSLAGVDPVSTPTRADRSPGPAKPRVHRKASRRRGRSTASAHSTLGVHYKKPQVREARAKLTSEQPEERIAALAVLRSHADAVSTVLVLRLAKHDPDPQVRVAALKALPFLVRDKRELVGAATSPLGDSEALVRKAALELLRELPTKIFTARLKSGLKALAEKGSPSERTMAASLLDGTAQAEWQAERQASLIRSATKGADPQTRARALAELPNVIREKKRLLVVAVQALGDQDASVREAALSALPQVPTALITPELRDRIRTLAESDSYKEQSSNGVRYPVREVAGDLLRYLKIQGEKVRE